MPKIVLDLESNLEELFTVLNKGEDLVNKTATAVTVLGKDTKAAFSVGATEADKFSKNVTTASAQTSKLSSSVDTIPKAASSIKVLNSQLRTYVEEVNSAKQGTKEWQEAIDKATETKEKIKELQALLAGIGSNDTKKLTQAFQQVTQAGIEGFEGIVAVESLFGEKNEDIEKQLLKLQSLQALSNIVGEFSELNEKVKEFKVAFSPITTLYSNANNALKNFFKNGTQGAVQVAASNKSLSESLITGIQKFVTTGINGLKSLWATIAANPLGIIIVVIAGLITAVVTLRDKIKPFAAIFDFFAKGFSGLFEGIEKLAQAFHLVASENEKANKKIIESTKEVMDEISRFYDFEIALAAAASKVTAALEDDKTRALKLALQTRLNAFKDIQKENGKLTDDELKEYKEFLKQYEDLTNQSSVALVKLQTDRHSYLRTQQRAAEALRISNIKDDQTREEDLLTNQYKNNLEDLKDTYNEQRKFVLGEEQASYEFYKENQNRIKAQEQSYQKQLQDIRYKYYLQRIEQIKQYYNLEKSYAQAIEDLSNKTALSQSVTGEEKVEIEKKQALESLSNLRDSLINQGQAIEDFQAKKEKRLIKTFQLAQDQEDQLGILQQNVYRDTTQKLILLEVDRANKLAAAKVEAAGVNSQNADVEEKNAISTVDLMAKPKDTTEIDFELEKQKAILNIQKEYAIKRLEAQLQLNEAQQQAAIKAANGEISIISGREDEEAKITKQGIIDKLELQLKSYGLQREELQDATAKILNDLESRTEKASKLPPIDLIKLLGLKEEDVQNIQASLQAVGDGLSSFVNLEEQRLDKEMKQSEDRQAANEKDISDLQGKLGKEKDLQQKGKANNVELVESQLQVKIDAQKKEEDLQKIQLERKKEFQKEQLKIDTLVQASQLVTASANILATTARDPVSLAIALASIAAMIAGFTISKVNAFKAVNEGLTLKDGEIDIKGPGTETSDSIKANLSRGESVMTAKETRENKSLLLGIRQNNHPLIMDGILNLIKGTGVTLSMPSINGISSKRDEVKNSEINIIINNHNMQQLKEQQITNIKLDALIISNSNSTFVNGKGDMIKQRGNHVTITRNG